ncbi:MAG: cation:proton antiporter [Candidatus Izemoplasma sp.]|nr:cation:proton antiporter [Candidatus Izemoplasma sp.]
MFYLLATDYGSSFFLNLSLLIIIGLMGGIIFHRFKLPKVTGYIFAGILFGPNAIGLISGDFITDLKLVKILAMGFIGFNIGMEVKGLILKNKGLEVILITIIQALFTFAVVFAFVYFLASTHNIVYALILASIATVTTPAPIIACMRSYQTQGTLSELIPPVVALDDIVGIIVFTLILPFAIFLAGHEGEVITFMELIQQPLFDIAMSVFIGLLLGYFTSLVIKYLRHSTNMSLELIIVVSIMISVGISELVNMSDILIPLVMGIVITNFFNPEIINKIKNNTDTILLPLLLVFFTMSGADLRIQQMDVIGILTIIYLFARIFGKVFGTMMATYAVKENTKAKKFLGLMMIPQGGVALDMAILAELRFVQIAQETGNIQYEIIGQTIFTVVLSAVIVYKLIGEIIVKKAFEKAGEIHDHDQTSLDLLRF